MKWSYKKAAAPTPFRLVDGKTFWGPELQAEPGVILGLPTHSAMTWGERCGACRGNSAGGIATPTPATQPDWMTMRDAAKHIAKSYSWLSRKWKSLGLRPRALGRDYRFSRQELDAAIARQRPVPRGKFAKVVRVVHA